MIAFRLTMKDGAYVLIDFELRNGALIPTAFYGDTNGSFDFAQWEASCRAFVDLAAARGQFVTCQFVSQAARLAWSMALDGWWDKKTPEPVPEQKRLGVHNAVARVIWHMVQGQEVSTREAADLMTRTRCQTFRFMKTVEAGGHLPLYYDTDTKKWRLLATRYLRI